MYIINELEIVDTDKQTTIVNLINGNADLIEESVAKKIRNKNYKDIDIKYQEELIKRKYAFRNETEYKSYLKEFDSKLIKESELEAPNFVYVPTYQCNLNCYYCFEKAYEKNLNDNMGLNHNVDKLFDAMNSIIEKLEERYQCSYRHEDIPLTLTGGEALLESNYDIIKNIFMRCQEERFPISIVTNGTTLECYFDIIREYHIKKVQVTLDGGKSIHDKIRITSKGEGTYDCIVKNVKRLKEYVDEVSVRINITKKNINSIPELGRIIDQNPDIEFYVYIMQQEGCCDYENVLDEVEALKYLYNLKEQYSTLNNLYIEYHGRKIIDGIFGKKMFSPKIKMCSAMQNQYIIDNAGGIYKCWWGMGNKDYLIGKIEEVLRIEEEVLRDYMSRTVLKIEKCKKCKYRYLCGGACSGRLTRENLKQGEVLCPDFSRIFNYVIPYKLEKMEERAVAYENQQ